MPIRRLRSACFCALFCCSAAAAALAKPAEKPGPQEFSLHDGDRVVLLGSTFIERAQSHGYLETALISRFPGANIQFRNLGWSGDNVFGQARAGFGPIEEGFKHLKEHVLDLRPTVILLNYGANESFAGEAGLDRFLAGLDVLLKTLDETGAKIVFLTLPPHEDLGRPLPDPTQHNRNLKLYSGAIAKVAGKRGAPVVNLFELLNSKSVADADVPLTDNGLHLTAYGYWRAAPQLERGLGLPDREWQIEVDVPHANISARGTQVSQARFAPDSLRFVVHDAQLPLPPAPADSPADVPSLCPRTLRVFDLPAGIYELTVDDAPVAKGDATEWAHGITITRGPEFDQAERLRQTILEKNELYFHRWRPQNVTYLFGFRKHEQGNNAVEIPQFDPLVEARETTIRSLSMPANHAYQLVKVK